MTATRNHSTTVGSQLEALRLVVTGRVQGVGFRPFVFRMASRFNLTGAVRNSPCGVRIEVQGRRCDIDSFRHVLTREPPDGAAIEAVVEEPIALAAYTEFSIGASDGVGQASIRVPPDRAVCRECRCDVADPDNRRFGYPFTNCTVCGPRYSIIDAMPYDRGATTMRHFVMCPSCRAEYGTPGDRRFHAQPNACPVCGPCVAFWNRSGATVAAAGDAIIKAAGLIRDGGILALKGLGGFLLLARADSPTAIDELRHRKRRPRKPFAVMVASVEAAESLAVLGSRERDLLTSAENPIVVVQRRTGSLPESVAPSMKSIGLFLPTTPLHQLLLGHLELPVIATSGNSGDEPIATDESLAVADLALIADAFLVHDRPIHRGVDDSVTRCIGERPVTLRLARGLAPLSLPAIEASQAPPILATGGHQNTAVALWTGEQAVLSQHIGDLDNAATRNAFVRTVDDLTRLYQTGVGIIACDFHPDYFTTRWANDQGRRVIAVQHHHAHAVACMVEHHLLDRETAALTWDGTGFGLDGTIWGGELLLARVDGFRRAGSLRPFRLPGGDAAVRHPARTAFGLLWESRGSEAVVRDESLLRRLGLSSRDAAILDAMLRRGINSPWTSSMGRLFDAVAALILPDANVTFEGEAAMRLESLAVAKPGPAYPVPMGPDDRGLMVGDWGPMIDMIETDFARGVEVELIASMFHRSVATWGAAIARCVPHRDVVLTGGCFQNAILTELTRATLEASGRRVYSHERIPPGDGGLAVGQLAVAMARCSCDRHNDGG